MTFTEIMNLFTLYGVDVVVLGFLTTVLTQILKTTLLKNAPNKVYTFLPLVIGAALYAVYAMLTNMSFNYVFENFAQILERGFSVSAVAAIIYSFYEQFIRDNGEKTESASESDE